jgi:hypothetical protein
MPLDDTFDVVGPKFARRGVVGLAAFYKDDYTPMDFVVFAVTRVFHRSTEDALALDLGRAYTRQGDRGHVHLWGRQTKAMWGLLMAKIEEHPLGVEVERAWRQAGNPARHHLDEYLIVLLRTWVGKTPGFHLKAIGAATAF